MPKRFNGKPSLSVVATRGGVSALWKCRLTPQLRLRFVETRPFCGILAASRHNGGVSSVPAPCPPIPRTSGLPGLTAEASSFGALAAADAEHVGELREGGLQIERVIERSEAERTETK